MLGSAVSKGYSINQRLRIYSASTDPGVKSSILWFLPAPAKCVQLSSCQNNQAGTRMPLIVITPRGYE